MTKVLIISVIIIIVTLVVFVAAISKGYSYKHTVDPIDNNPNLDGNAENDDKTNG
ncbi:YtzI protein [Alkalihalobacillus sp. AL-G]|uniref:YtzI protein n=1 Tax=Alkalihalobacillus sp. AL-G TaxID=2926399 RepID=UPI00272C7EED|nr:YtzI protein [Alkalihalobacillus sp. AL-G]WLD94173.1 YtzI protein [Alkalihalobacillus sp. AL-G]